MIRSIAILAALTACTLNASAGTLFTAELDPAHPNSGKYIAAHALWKCDGAVCRAELPRSKVKLKTCREVAGQVGRLTSFRTDTHYLKPRDLEKCNRAAATPSEKIVASR